MLLTWPALRSFLEGLIWPVHIVGLMHVVGLMHAFGLVHIVGLENIVWREWGSVHLAFHHLHTVFSNLLEIRAMVALISVEKDDDGQTASDIHPFPLAIDEHRCQQVVVDKEHDEEECVLLPYSKYFLPIERDVCVCSTNGQTHHWR